MNYSSVLEKYNNLEIQYLTANIKDVVDKSVKIASPPKQIDIIEWAQNNIVLDDTSPIPGPFRIENSPHLRDILKAAVDPKVRKITIMGSSQIGKTLLLQIIWAYFVDQDPSPMLIGQPTDSEVKSFALHKLEKMIDSTEILRKKVAKKKRGNSEDSSTRLKMYNGGWTEIISITSKGKTRQRSVKRVFGDDIDAVEFVKSSEGDHVANFMKRTSAYKYDYLHYNISTPSIEGMSRIHKMFESGSMEYFYVNCPKCDYEQTLTDDQLYIEKDQDVFGNVQKYYSDGAKIACKKCGELLSEKDRFQMLQNGRYKAKNKNETEHRSFQIGQLSSTLSTLQNVAIEKINAEKAAQNGDESSLESYYNLVLGLPYKRIRGKETDAKILIDRREDYININSPNIPNGVLLITAAVDIQAGSGLKPARYETEVWGWGKYEEAWILDKFAIPGNPEKSEVREKLDKYLSNKKFIRKDNKELRIVRIGIDSGYLAQTVYEYVAHRYAKDGLCAIKGTNKYGAPLIPKKITYVNNGKSVLLNIGTQASKTIIYNRLNEIKEPGPKYIHFTKAFCDIEYFEQLTSEHAVTKTVGLNQYIVYEKKKHNISNEAIDLLNYNYAMMKTLNPNWDALERKINKEESVEKPKEIDLSKPKKKVMIKKKDNPLVW